MPGMDFYAWAATVAFVVAGLLIFAAVVDAWVNRDRD